MKDPTTTATSICRGWPYYILILRQKSPLTGFDTKYAKVNVSFYKEKYLS